MGFSSQQLDGQPAQLRLSVTIRSLCRPVACKDPPAARLDNEYHVREELDEFAKSLSRLLINGFPCAPHVRFPPGISHLVHATAATCRWLSVTSVK